MQVSREEVERIAALAHLDLTPEELARMQNDLSEILGYVALLQALDLDAVQPLAQVGGAEPGAEARWRPDEVREGFSQAQALANAPRSAAGCFQVPRVLGAEEAE
ncbi:MAG: Asp-tRNA(Asn)/Glu-tRNA(Gln) amidotransferase subunit GatC [Terriglobales bacterium]